MDEMIACSVIAVAAGCVLFALPTRSAPPVLISAVSSILAGGFTLDLKLWKIGVPHEAIGPISMIWFALWVLALPILLVTLGTLFVLARRQPRFLLPAGIVLVALAATSLNTVRFWRAAAMGVVVAPGLEMPVEDAGLQRGIGEPAVDLASYVIDLNPVEMRLVPPKIRNQNKTEMAPPRKRSD